MVLGTSESKLGKQSEKAYKHHSFMGDFCFIYCIQVPALTSINDSLSLNCVLFRNVHAVMVKKEALNLEESEEGYTGGLEGRDVAINL